MALKKSQLYSSLWSSCDELRGSMDASQYKDYVLVLLFVKYVSDKYAGQKDADLEVPAGASFSDMVKLKGNPEIGDKINTLIGKITDANEVLKGIALPDFNDDDKLGKGKEKVERLSNLVSIFDNQALDFRGNRAEGDDLLGDAYEYLMRHFATESGKSKGQFYTPAEVSRVMAKVIDLGAVRSASQSVYDPTCGSGSLLLKAHDEALNRTKLDLALYGQENDNATAALAKMNMVLHGCPTAEIWKDNTLSTPYFKEADGRLKTFDFVVANFPFSNKNWMNGVDPDNDPYHRFEYGVPPAKNGDYAFLLHIIASLKSTGKGAVIHPHGVLFRGNSEAEIRKRLIQQGYIKGIIGLPPNLFYGTGIPACILILDKEKAATRTSIFMVDASKGFMKDGPKNRLRAQDIHKIVDAFTRQLEIPGYSRMVPVTEISDPKNDYNLNLPRYIDSSEAEDLQDIDGHLRGGIPASDIDALGDYWQVLPSMRALLFESAGRPGYIRLKTPVKEIKAAILNHPEFKAYQAAIIALFAKWKTANSPRLNAVKIADDPKALIESLSEQLFTAFKDARLIDSYDLYQHIMDYWAETMQDDVYLIAEAGWVEAARPRLIVEAKDQKNREEPDYTIGKSKYKADLVPPALLVARYFAKDQSDIEALEEELTTLEARLDELKEEHCVEGGLLEEVVDEKDKISKKVVAARLKEIAHDKEAADERRMLVEYNGLLDKQTELKSRLKAAREALVKSITGKYGKLTEMDIKAMVVNDKWLARISGDLAGELDRVSRTLTNRIRELAERYAQPLPQITKEVDELSNRVDEHLKKMGFVW